MKRLISMVFVLAIIVGGLGFYRGWFTMSSDGDTQSDKIDVNLTIDTVKVKEDSEALKDKTKSLTDKVND
ncbi:MAG: hypothetical protein ACKVT0_13075 [Planctomycetaceae bacterium]